MQPYTFLYLSTPMYPFYALLILYMLYMYKTIDIIDA